MIPFARNTYHGKIEVITMDRVLVEAQEGQRMIWSKDKDA
jgi:hypothetical protein